MSLDALNKLARRLRELPKVVAGRVTDAAAPKLTAIANADFDAGRDPYGVAWPPGADGHRVTLRRSGALGRLVRYVGIGTKLRVALVVPYAKYQIGRFRVFPRQGATLPKTYTEAISATVADVCAKELA